MGSRALAAAASLSPPRLLSPSRRRCRRRRVEPPRRCRGWSAPTTCAPPPHSSALPSPSCRSASRHSVGKGLARRWAVELADGASSSSSSSSAAAIPDPLGSGHTKTNPPAFRHRPSTTPLPHLCLCISAIPNGSQVEDRHQWFRQDRSPGVNLISLVFVKVYDDSVMLDKTVAEQVSIWKSKRGLNDELIGDHTCSGDTCTYTQIGDVFVCEKTGRVHVCDDTCREIILDQLNGHFVCTISGRVSDSWLSFDNELNTEQGEMADEAEPFMGSGRFG